MDDTAALVHQLAVLARLDISGEEQDRLAKQLPSILDYVGQLQKVQTEIVPSPRDEQARLRPDDVSVSKAVEAILEQAPEKVDGFWKVSGVFS